MPKLVTKTTWSVLDKSERKTSRPGPVTAGKGFTLSISNEDMGDIIKIINSLEKSGLLIYGVADTVKHKIQKQEDGCISTYGCFIDRTYSFFMDTTC